MNLGFDCRADIIDFVENEEDLENVEKSIVALFVVCLLLGIQLVCCEWWVVWIDGDKIDFYGPVMCIKDDRKNCLVTVFSAFKIVFLAVMGIGLLYVFTFFKI